MVSKRVCIADDDEVVQVLVESSLTPEFSVMAYGDGASLLAGIATDQPEVVLLDLEMTGMSGLEVCARLKEDFATAEIPVVFLSGHDEIDARMQAYEAGADDYIVKPVAPDELRAKIRVVARIVEQRKALSSQSSDAQRAAFSAMASMGEMGAVMQFMRSSFACMCAEDLLGVIADYYAHTGVSGGAQLRGEEGNISRVIGTAAPLTGSVLDGIQNVGRIFEFSNRLAINYPMCTLLICNLPIDDADQCGRIRDNFALVAEAAEIRLKAIDATRRLCGVGAMARAAADRARSAAERYVGEAQVYRQEVLTLLEALVIDFERAFVHLGLTENQEATMVDLVQKAGKRVLDAAQPLQSFERDFEGVIGELAGIDRLTQDGRMADVRH